MLQNHFSRNIFFHQLVSVCTVVKTICQRIHDLLCEDRKQESSTWRWHQSVVVLPAWMRPHRRMRTAFFQLQRLRLDHPRSRVRCASAVAVRPHASLPCTTGLGLFLVHLECDRFHLWSRASHRLLYRPHNPKSKAIPQKASMDHLPMRTNVAVVRELPETRKHPCLVFLWKVTCSGSSRKRLVGLRCSFKSPIKQLSSQISCEDSSYAW